MSKGTGVGAGAGEISIQEKHYTVKELAERWNMSVGFVRRLFRNEPGVVKVGRAKVGHQRAYYLTRIPESVAERVYRRSTKA